MERYAVTRREDKPAQVQYVYVPKACKRRHVEAKDQETRERLYFNAGRYTAGARDKTATTAYEALQKELTK
jgi:hypothetical protein